ncbi:MAG: septal ring lytic transglycosylase RlpA family protein, partial [Gammaproteobacteria bacterium]|nr:septal ring lytic transglycosylase RlpA family protein [Gammaproteobacteria bacterium]
MKTAPLAWVALTAVLLGGCSAYRWEQPAPNSDRSAPVNQDMTRTKRGNPPFYEVFGVRYQVMNSSDGYRQRGVASWYGKKFHGRQTSNGERYDMYRMTAAHKTLPLPTNVKVTNLDNGRSVIVRVNDRGPFVKGRIIDMSYAAAQALDMTQAGTARVEVVALDTSYTGAIAAVSATQPAAGKSAETAARAPADPVMTDLPAQPRMYVQVGAFGEVTNARNLAEQLSGSGVNQVNVLHPASG